VSEYFVTIPQTIPHQSSTWKEQFNAYKQETIKGFLYVWNIPGLQRLFVVSALINIFSAPIVVLLPFYVEDYLKVKIDWYGFFLVVYSAGLMLGSLSAGFIKLKGEARKEMMMIFMVLNAIIIGLLGFANGPIMAMVYTFLIGIMGGFNSTNVVTILQIST